MRIPWTGKLCERLGVNAIRHEAQSVAAGRFFERVVGQWRSAELYSAVSRICNPPDARNAGAVPNAIRRYSRLKICATTGTAFVMVLFNYCVAAQSTNSPAATNGAPSDPPRVESPAQGSDEPAFRVVTERNIFNANRSGGQVRLPTQRPARIEFFTLVGTMAYEKGVFAFFEGSSSEFTKVMKADSVIAGHKLVDIYASSVKLEADGKEIELPVGSQMRREDEGTWHVAETSVHSGGSSNASSGNGDSASRESSGRSSRSGRGGDSSSRSRSRSENPPESASRSSSNTSTSSADQAEILKRLMERREKESQ
jgi:hypothetical protein